MIAIGAAGVAALVLFRPRSPAAARDPLTMQGAFDRATTFVQGTVAPIVEPVALDFGNWLRRIDPRVPAQPQDYTHFHAQDFYDPVADRWNYPGVGAAIYRWGPGEGW